MEGQEGMLVQDAHPDNRRGIVRYSEPFVVEILTLACFSSDTIAKRTTKTSVQTIETVVFVELVSSAFPIIDCR